MRAPSIGTALRLGRIAALVAACLLFLHACDRTRRLLPIDVWLELAAAALLAAAAMIAAWFEIVRTERIEEAEELEANDPPAPRADDFLYDTSTHAIRARIARSGNLVIHGREHGGPYPGHEWSWTFRTDTFPAIRNALGDDGDVLDLLEEVVPRLDADSRADPGAWLRAHGIAGTYREKGDHPSRTTHKLPILRPGLRRATESTRSRLAGDESIDGTETPEPTRRGSRRSGSPTEATSARTARSTTPESRGDRSGPTRRVEPDPTASARRRPGASAPGSGPIRTGERTPEPRPASRSGPPPTTAQHPDTHRDNSSDHSGPIAGATRRRSTDLRRDSGPPPDSGSPPAVGSTASTRRRRRGEDDPTERPDLPRRARQRAAADDPPDTSIHGSRRPFGAEPPAPGLFSARTGIDPTDPPQIPAPRSRPRLAGRNPSPPPDRPPARLPGYPDETAYPGNAAYRYDNPDHDRPNHGNPGYDSPDYDDPDPPAPDPPRRRGHRYR